MHTWPNFNVHCIPNLQIWGEAKRLPEVKQKWKEEAERSSRFGKEMELQRRESMRARGGSKKLTEEGRQGGNADERIGCCLNTYLVAWTDFCVQVKMSMKIWIMVRSYGSWSSFNWPRDKEFFQESSQLVWTLFFLKNIYLFIWLF